LDDFSKENTNSNNFKKLTDFILITGDFLSHGIEDINSTQYEKIYFEEFNSTKIKIKLFDEITEKLIKTFPNIPLIPTIGNSDFLEDNFIPENNSYFDYFNLILKKKFQILLNNGNGNGKIEFDLSEFSENGGCYVVNFIPSLPNVKILSFNSVIFNNIKKSNFVLSLAERQIKFILKQFEIAKLENKKITTISHSSLIKFIYY
jgi:hypothetical protein